MASPRGATAASTYALPYKRLDPLSSRKSDAATPRSLSTIQFDATLGSAAAGSGALFSLLSSAPALSRRSRKTSSADAPPGAPKFPVKPQHPHLRTSVAETADFLHTLRARSLLDYTFMREFSLARTKPVPERSLSKLSASSVYSMRMAQLSLEEQGRTFAGRQQWLMKPEPLEAEEPALSSRDSSVVVSKSSDDVRAPSPASREQPAHRNATRFKRTRRLKAASNSSTSKNESSLAVSCFPTLWGDSAGSHVATTTTTKSVRSTGVSRHPSRPAEPTSRGATPHAPPVVACEDPTASDLRKCHPGAVVAEHHGFLSEQEIPALMATTGYSRTELYALWARFKALCSLSRGPEGIDRATFHRGIPHLSVEDDFFVDRVFAILDADGSGILEWQEFVDALSSLERGDVAKRVDFLFRVYDLNGDGTIHRSEATQFFLASLLVAPSGEAESVARHFVDKIFAAAGCGDKDAMRIDGAMAYMHRHPDADIYSLFGRTMVAGRQLPLVPAASPGQQTAATADSFFE